MERQGRTPAGAKELLERFRESEEIRRATLNILEDMDAERKELAEAQHALMNMLEDVEAERVKAEQAKTLLESVNKELEAFSYSVSHDLRAPLRAISGFSQAIMEDYADRLDDEGRRYFGLIQTNAHRMGRLIDDLLAFSRLGRQQMSEMEIDMETMARSVYEELAAQEPDRKIGFTIHPAPPVRGDNAMIRQVLVNLFANAVKFTRTREEASIDFGYLPECGEGAYYVKDNGVGFDPKYAGKLFGVFQRLHSAAEFDGTGVGLALVHRIVTRHGGRVWAEGQVDRGATFYFSLSRRQ